MELTLELQSRQVVQKRMGQRIRKEVWDNMEVKGKAIKVSSELNSTNYNLLGYKLIAAAPCTYVGYSTVRYRAQLRAVAAIGA